MLAQSAGGSHVSPCSTALLPHTGVQSLSLTALHPGGQHPSLLLHIVCMPALTHCTLHDCGDPSGTCN
jgi:hypothetical protein